MPVHGVPPDFDLAAWQKAQRELAAAERDAALRRELDAIRWAKVSGVVAIALVVSLVALLKP